MKILHLLVYKTEFFSKWLQKERPTFPHSVWNDQEFEQEEPNDFHLMLY